LSIYSNLTSAISEVSVCGMMQSRNRATA